MLRRGLAEVGLEIPPTTAGRLPTPGRILIVRLGSLGDIIHAIPAAAALRRAFPQARIDWLVDIRHRALLDLVSPIDRQLAIDTGSMGSLAQAVVELRRGRYDVALDLQGLLKSAILARLSGARRVIGFPAGLLRERVAVVFYTETGGAAFSTGPHIIQKNLSMLRVLGIEHPAIEFPLEIPKSDIVSVVRRRLGLGGEQPFAILNPGAAWPNKRWPPACFGEVAAALHERHGLRSIVLWGPSKEDQREETIAKEIVSASRGAAELSPQTSIAELVALVRSAALMVSGDTGPLHVAAAAGTPLVGIYGPTSPERNGPWSAADLTVSRFQQCQCHHLRRCRGARWCLLDVSAGEVIDLVNRRLASVATHG
jgi:lipopolysaccharide heptosyltransferase I